MCFDDPPSSRDATGAREMRPALTPIARLATFALAALLAGPFAARATEEAVPGPLRPLGPAGDAVATTPVLPGKPTKPVVVAPPLQRDAKGRPLTPAQQQQAAQPAKVWVGVLAPVARGELARGKIRLDTTTRRVEIADFAVTDAPDLEVALVAADRIDDNAALMAAKRVSLGRLKRIRSPLALKVPEAVDPAVYRTLAVWSRRDRAPRGLARLQPERPR